MRERQDRLRGITQLHTPSTAEPLIVLIIDELAALTGWVNDRTVKRRIEAALGLLLSQGRAAGVARGRRHPGPPQGRPAATRPVADPDRAPDERSRTRRPGPRPRRPEPRRQLRPDPAPAPRRRRSSRSTASPNPSGSASPATPSPTSPTSADTAALRTPLPIHRNHGGLTHGRTAVVVDVDPSPGRGPARPGPTSAAGSARSSRSGTAPTRSGSPAPADTINPTTGEVLGSLRPPPAEPDGVTYVRCGNRRASVCPSCSHEYKGDVWHVLMAGAAGGIKDVPDDGRRASVGVRHLHRALLRTRPHGEEARPARQPPLHPPHRRPAAGSARTAGPCGA